MYEENFDQFQKSNFQCTFCSMQMNKRDKSYVQDKASWMKRLGTVDETFSPLCEMSLDTLMKCPSVKCLATLFPCSGIFFRLAPRPAKMSNSPTSFSMILLPNSVFIFNNIYTLFSRKFVYSHCASLHRVPHALSVPCLCQMHH